MTDDKAVFIATPMHDERVAWGAGRGIFGPATERREVMPMGVTSGLVQMNCNGLLAIALNLRERDNLGWFAMLHSDIDPEAFWIDKLIAICEEREADFVSATVAIKDSGGETSTAYSDPCDEFATTRLHLREIAQLPTTFGLKDLDKPAGTEFLCNTGCCVFRLDRSWLDPTKVYFHCQDKLKKDFAGNWCAHTIAEDWFFTRSIARNGGLVLATSAIETIHNGRAKFKNRLQ